MTAAAVNIGVARLCGVLGVAMVAWLCVADGGVQAQADVARTGDDELSSSSDDYDDVLDHAMDAFDAHDYAQARVLFERAWALRPNARVLRGLGISALYLERFTLAKRELSQALVATAQPLTASQRQGVEELLTWMEQSLGTLRLELRPSDALVTLDDKPVAERELVVKPGTHRFHVTAEGFTPEDTSVEIEAGQDKRIDLSLSRDPSSLSSPRVSAADLGVSAFIGGAASTEPGAETDRGPANTDSGTVLQRWWFWTAVGVVIAGGAATAVVLATRDSARKSYEGGGLGGVLMPLERFP